MKLEIFVMGMVITAAGLLGIFFVGLFIYLFLVYICGLLLWKILMWALIGAIFIFLSWIMGMVVEKDLNGSK